MSVCSSADQCGRMMRVMCTISVAEAADLLGLTRPYMAMLCDAGQLGAIATDTDGHRLIKLDEVERYRAESADMYRDAPGVREAGIEAGLYDFDG